MTLFHPASGQARVKGVRRCPNAVLHPWLQAELTEILAPLPDATVLPAEENRRQWERWQAGLSVRITFPYDLPPLRLLLILDNLTGHHSATFVLWVFRHRIMPFYTPLGGSWLNMAAPIQRILKRRALDGCHPQTADAIIAWLKAAARAWNQDPTPFVWGGKRHARRERSHVRRHSVVGACWCRPSPGFGWKKTMAMLKSTAH